jgi:intergrase/recombinase
MICKKNTHKKEKCMCLKRKHGGCSDCEKKAIKTVQESGRDLNETIKFVKETDETIEELYVEVRETDKIAEAYRSAIDILRGVCDYCQRRGSMSCKRCMWSNRPEGEDNWFFIADV